VKLLLDEMLPASIAGQLRRRGHDVLAVSERAELRGLPDEELFEIAARESRAIVTYNRDDYLELDRRCRSAGREHPGVVILNPRRFPQGTAIIGTLVTALDRLVQAGSPYPGFVLWLR